MIPRPTRPPSLRAKPSKPDAEVAIGRTDPAAKDASSADVRSVGVSIGARGAEKRGEGERARDDGRRRLRESAYQTPRAPLLASFRTIADCR